LSHAFVIETAGKAVREAIEYAARKFGIELTEDAGRVFAEKSGQFLVRYGDDGIRALRSAGPEILELAARHGDDAVRMAAAHADEAVLYLVRHADDALPVWKAFGKEGTELMLKHPGLAEPMLKEFGKDGLALGQKLSAQGLQRFLVLSQKAGSAEEKKTLLDAVLSGGQKVLDFLWLNKGKLAAGATAYTLLHNFNEGTISTTNPDGSTVKKGLLPYCFDAVVSKTLANYPWLPLAALAVLAFWLFPFLRYMWRIPRRISDWFRKKEPAAVGVNASGLTSSNKEPQ
jgi:hypothetical protein